MLPWLPGLTGWIENFQRTSTSQIAPLAGGRGCGFGAGAARAGGAHRFRIRDLGKVADGAGGRRGAHERAGDERDRIASGVGRVPIPAVPLLAGSTALEICAGSGAVAGFEAGNLLACDVDLRNKLDMWQRHCAAYVSNSSDVQDDANYVRASRST